MNNVIIGPQSTQKVMMQHEQLKIKETKKDARITQGLQSKSHHGTILPIVNKWDEVKQCNKSLDH